MSDLLRMSGMPMNPLSLPRWEDIPWRLLVVLKEEGGTGNKPTAGPLGVGVLILDCIGLFLTGKASKAGLDLTTLWPILLYTLDEDLERGRVSLAICSFPSFMAFWISAKKLGGIAGLVYF